MKEPATPAAEQATSVDVPSDAPTITIRRMLDAAPRLVFEAFADPEQVDQWWGPEGFRNTTHEHDFRPGGVWRFTMHGPDGTDYPNKIVFVEIDPPDRIAWEQGWDREEFEPMHWTAITLRTRKDRPDVTEVELQMSFPSLAKRDQAVRQVGAVEGGKQTLARWAAHVEARQ